MWIGDRELAITINHMLMLPAGDWAFPSERSEAFDQVGAADRSKTHISSAHLPD
jgi:hypothetical protein